MGRIAASIVAAVVVVGLGAAAVALVACSESSSPDSLCDAVCAREANCAQELEIDVDKAECLEHCRRLEREPDAVELVRAHARCVDEARTCREVLACK